MLQHAFQKALTLEAGLQLAEGVHLGGSSQVMKVSTDAHEPYTQEGA